jgi:hypothetical protein
MIGHIVNNKHVEAAAQSDAANQSAAQFKLAVSNALLSTSTAYADCLSPVWAMPQNR